MWRFCSKAQKERWGVTIILSPGRWLQWDINRNQSGTLLKTFSIVSFAACHKPKWGSRVTGLHFPKSWVSWACGGLSFSPTPGPTCRSAAPQIKPSLKWDGPAEMLTLKYLMPLLRLIFKLIRRTKIPVKPVIIALGIISMYYYETRSDPYPWVRSVQRLMSNLEH